MRRAAGLLALAGAAAAGALALEGPQAFGRLALRLGAPALAQPLLQSPHLQGLAVFARGDWAGAAAAFNRAGPSASYNRAAALALAGDIEGALLAYDAVLLRDPDDVQAAENRAVVARLDPRGAGEILPGDEAAGQGGGPDWANSPADKAVASDGVAEKQEDQARAAFAPVIALGRAEIRRTPDARATVANRFWLESFPDDPGLWLRAAVAAEHARRAELGLTPPEPESPW